MFKKICAGVLAAVIVFGAVGISGGENAENKYVLTASAADTIDLDTATVNEFREFIKNLTHDELVQFIYDNYIVAIWNELDETTSEALGIEDAYAFSFYGSYSSSYDSDMTAPSRLVRFAEPEENEFIWYVVIDDEAYIVDYVGECTKDDFITPASINGKKVAGYSESFMEGIIHAENFAEFGGGANHFFSGRKTVYVPRTVTKMYGDPFIWCYDDIEKQTTTILVNEGSFAQQYCEDKNLKYEIVPDDYAELPVITANDTNPDDTTPDDTQPDDTKPDDTKPDDTKPDDTKPDDTKPEDTKPNNTKPDDTKPDDTDPSDTTPDNTTPGDTPPDTTSEAPDTDDGAGSSNPTTGAPLAAVPAVLALSAGVAVSRKKK